MFWPSTNHHGSHFKVKEWGLVHCALGECLHTLFAPIVADSVNATEVHILILLQEEHMVFQEVL